MTVALSPVFNGWQGFSINGIPLAGGLLNTYAAGTTTPLATYTSSSGATPNANPIQLGSDGWPANEIWLTTGVAYKFVLTDSLGLNPKTFDNIIAPDPGSGSNILALLAASTGSALVGWIQAGVGAIARLVQDKLRDTVNVKDFGATAANSNAANKVCLQLAITARNTAGSGKIIVPEDISYGYKATDATTWPDFTGCTVPLTVLDSGPGNSYSGYPTAYDGDQIRTFMFTPQTTATLTFTAAISIAATSATLASNWAGATGPWFVTFSNGNQRAVTLTNGATTATWSSGLTTGATSSASYINQGQHDGNNQYTRGTWNPGAFISNDANYAAPGAPTRSALDNRRTNVTFGLDGAAGWAVMTQGQIGASATNEDMFGFSIQKFAITGDTLGAYAPLFVQRSTGNAGYGIGTLVPAASHHFGPVANLGNYCGMFENPFRTTVELMLRTSVGASDDVGLFSRPGLFCMNIVAQGDAIQIDKTNRRVFLPAALQMKRNVVTYSASMTIDAALGNLFQITATNGTAFTINAPTNPADGQPLTVTIRNTFGALGVATWNAAFKMTAWTQPANGFSRTIRFYYDGTNTNWVEQSRTAADVPN